MPADDRPDQPQAPLDGPPAADERTADRKRIPLEFIVELVNAGWGIESILRSYPGVTREDIEAAIGGRAPDW